MANAFWGVSAACVAAIATGWNAIGLRSVVDPPHPVAGLDASDSYASASLLGQFRTSTSSWLWLRTDLYLHNGVELRPLTESEKKQGETGVGTSEHDLSKALNEDNVVTSIPSADRDFRGWMGDLDRATAPYKDMHNHTHNNPEQAIPLFRLMTWIDPNFVEGWTTGSTVIARDRTQQGTDKALNFLFEGLKANPGSVSILDEIGFVYITREKNLVTAVQYLEQARASGSKTYRTMPDEEKDDFDEVYRWLGLCYRDLGERDKMMEVLAEGNKLFPDDAVISMMLNPPPSILSEYGIKQWNAEQTAKAKEQAASGESDAHDMH